jgi:hypothetical protein
MKTRLFATATAAAAATVLLALPGAAQTLKFGTDGIQFEKDTWLQFTFKEDNGWFNSTLSVYEILSNGSTQMVGNLGGEVQDAKSSFTFLASKVYTLGLTNYNPDNGSQIGKTIYSTSSLNWGYKNGGAGYQQSLFTQKEEFPGLTEKQAFGDAGSYISADPLTGTGAKISFEDSGMPFGADADYNDFVVEVAPEPITMTGMALGGAGLFAARRRRRRQSKQG